ncbi:MAG: hypothetical protein K9G13_02115 [Aquiluna sp.]|nr:hypothetical protein [Aquiluna sp.]MCF8545320.1 hypothetical protein [Aquiluna sp.]
MSELVSKAGLADRAMQVWILVFGSAIAVFSSSLLWTGVTGLAICLSLLVTAAGFEILRVMAEVRQRSLERSWPQVFDSFQSAAESGIGIQEQFGYLAKEGPVALRQELSRLENLLEAGYPLDLILEDFKDRLANRHADLLALLLVFAQDLGDHGMAKNWERISQEVREEQAVIGQALAKQGWVSGSAKVALLAPWLIALVLIQLEQNKVAFASELGSLVLVFGLLLSFVAYALVNRLGRIPLQERIFNGTF